MDHDKWISQSCGGSLDCADSKEENSTTVPPPAATAASARTFHDMAQAKLMRRPRNKRDDDDGASGRGSSSEVTVDDLNLGLKGLDQAKAYQRQGQLEASLKLYELAIELLIRFLKDAAEDDTNRSFIEIKVRTALSDAEAIKTSLAGSQKQKASAGLNKQSSFRSITSALASALGGSSSSSTTTKKKSPTNAAITTTNIVTTTATRKGSSKPQTRNNNTSGLRRPQQQTATTTRARPTRTNTVATTSNRISPTSASAAAATELRQTILSEFYVSPADLQKTTWNDIAGLDNVKQALQETAILPLIRPDLFTGLRRPENILLYGPPGTGKTLLVRAVAYESGSNLFVCTSSALTSKWMGEAEKMIRTLFQVARELAPSIVFLDEMDALLSSRKSDGGGEHEASRRLKTEFMVQMEGIATKNSSDGDNDHMLLIACTNCPWDVDSAVLRRFPRRILVPLPDSEARRGLIVYLLKKAGKHSLTARHISTLVKRTEGFSCSDITAIASEASFGPLRSLGGMDAIKGCAAADVRPVQLADFEAVINQTTKSVSQAQLQRFDQWQKQQSAS